MARTWAYHPKNLVKGKTNRRAGGPNSRALHFVSHIQSFLQKCWEALASKEQNLLESENRINAEEKFKEAAEELRQAITTFHFPYFFWFLVSCFFHFPYFLVSCFFFLAFLWDSCFPAFLPGGSPRLSWGISHFVITSSDQLDSWRPAHPKMLPRWRPGARSAKDGKT